jgi:hypothetical protein
MSCGRPCPRSPRAPGLPVPGRQGPEVIGGPDQLAPPLALERWFGGIHRSASLPTGRPGVNGSDLTGTRRSYAAPGQVLYVSLASTARNQQDS